VRQNTSLFGHRTRRALGASSYWETPRDVAIAYGVGTTRDPASWEALPGSAVHVSGRGSSDYAGLNLGRNPELDGDGMPDIALVPLGMAPVELFPPYSGH